MTVIYAATNDQVLVATILPKLSQNNVNMVRLHVDFDSAWNSAVGKSAVFTTSKSPKVYEVLFSSDGDCLVPYEVLTEECKLHIAVKGVNSSNKTVKSSTRLTVRVLEGSPVSVVSDPSPSVYEQLVTANALLQARVNAMIGLEEGSTTGDAELIDARIDADGTTHDSAGNAVRGQFNDARKNLKSIFEANNENLFDPFSCFENCAIASADGSFFTATTYWCTKKLPLNGAAKLYCNHSIYKCAFYDSNGDYIGDASNSSNYIKEYSVPDGATYYSAQFAVTNVTFSERFDVCIFEYFVDPDRMYARYKLPSERVAGELPFLLSCTQKDEINLFDPLKSANNRAMTDGGLLLKTAGHWVTDYIPVTSCEYVLVNAIFYKGIFYDENGEFVSLAAEKNGLVKTAVPTDAAYIRFQFAGSVVPYEDRFSIIVRADGNISDGKPKYTIDGANIDGYEVLAGLVKSDTNNLFDPRKSFSATAFATASGAMFASDSYWVSDYIPVDGFTEIVCNVTIYKYGWYDSDKNILGVNAPAPANAAYLLVQFAEETVPYASRFDIILCDKNKEITSVMPRYYLSKQADNCVGHIGEFERTIQLTGTTYMSDHTFIGDKLYVINASSDDHAEYASVTVYSVDVENKTSKYIGKFNHNLGHANSIDYCAGNDCLILGNGSSDSTLTGQIYILPNVSTKQSWEYSDCIKIDLASENWGIKTNVVWGEHNNGAYNIAYVITNNNANVRKILLTQTDGVFDGGYIVLGEWSTKPIDVNQGTVYYNGKLYIACGHAGLWMLEYDLKAGGEIAVKQHKDIFYNEAGKVLTNPFTEGITIKDNRIFLGGSNGKIYVYKI